MEIFGNESSGGLTVFGRFCSNCGSKVLVKKKNIYKCKCGCLMKTRKIECIISHDFSGVKDSK